MSVSLTHIDTEQRNAATSSIDTLSTQAMLELINAEDKKVALAVEQALPDLAKLVDAVVAAFRAGGRLMYIGAGTSGRLGVLDASECPPTYGVPEGMVVGIIAGGERALRHAVEHAEDNKELAVSDLKEHHLQPNDVLVGIAASGRTPYVLAGIEYAKSLGCVTAAIACSSNSAIVAAAHIGITLLPGPEVVTGSTRMKSGTATKMALNMITSGAMIKLGKVFGNLMVDVRPSNAKLVERQRQIVIQATGVTYEQAVNSLAASEQDCKLAIFMLLSNLEKEPAKAQLAAHSGVIGKALAALKS